MSNNSRSTGPRTPAGKARSSQNATKHGILSGALIPVCLTRYEDATVFHDLLASLRRELAPVGTVESMLVDTIAACHWRLGRLYRAEAAAIAEAQERAYAANAHRACLLLLTEADCLAIQEALDSGDNEALRGILDPQGIYPSCQGEGVVAMARDQLQRNRAETLVERVKDPQTIADRATLPHNSEVLLFARYESHLTRQLHRALTTLDHRQRQRHGDNSSSPEADGEHDGGGYPPSDRDDWPEADLPIGPLPPAPPTTPSSPHNGSGNGNGSHPHSAPPKGTAPKHSGGQQPSAHQFPAKGGKAGAETRIFAKRTLPPGLTPFQAASYLPTLQSATASPPCSGTSGALRSTQYALPRTPDV